MFAVWYNLDLLGSTVFRAVPEEGGEWGGGVVEKWVEITGEGEGGRAK